MNPKIKNIILFITIATVMIAVYFIFIKKEKEEANLITATNGLNIPRQTPTSTNKIIQDVDSKLAKEFLTLLLSVKNITLDDAIFTDVAFQNLRDSSIILSHDGSEGRLNPFAPIETGVDISNLNINQTPSIPTPQAPSKEAIPISNTVSTDVLSDNLLGQ